MKDLLTYLNRIPKYLREGPWSPMAYLVLGAFFAFIVMNHSIALTEFAQLVSDHSIKEPFWIQYFRAFFTVYGIWMVVVIVRYSGWWPLSSYTITSWNLMTARLLFAFLGHSTGFIPFTAIAYALRFPALVGCSVTVLVWWAAIVPIIHYLLDKEKRISFWRLNKSFPLLNVHLFNLPIVAVEFLYSFQPLQFFDLWIGLVVALIYVIFYLSVLDPAGLHFYIILTPRTVFCAVSYASILGLYYLLFQSWQWSLSQFME